MRAMLGAIQHWTDVYWSTQRRVRYAMPPLTGRRVRELRAMLAECGIERPTARQLAQAHIFDRRNPYVRGPRLTS